MTEFQTSAPFTFRIYIYEPRPNGSPHTVPRAAIEIYFKGRSSPVNTCQADDRLRHRAAANCQSGPGAELSRLIGFGFERSAYLPGVSPRTFRTQTHIRGQTIRVTCCVSCCAVGQLHADRALLQITLPELMRAYACMYHPGPLRLPPPESSLSVYRRRGHDPNTGTTCHDSCRAAHQEQSRMGCKQAERGQLPVTEMRMSIIRESKRMVLRGPQPRMNPHLQGNEWVSQHCGHL